MKPRNRKVRIRPYEGFERTRSRLPLVAGLEILKDIVRAVEGDVKSGELEVRLNITVDRGDHLERLVFTPTEAIGFAMAACDEFLELAKVIKQLQREKGGQ